MGIILEACAQRVTHAERPIYYALGRAVRATGFTPASTSRLLAARQRRSRARTQRANAGRGRYRSRSRGTTPALVWSYGPSSNNAAGFMPWALIACPSVRNETSWLCSLLGPVSATAPISFGVARPSWSLTNRLWIGAARQERNGASRSIAPNSTRTRARALRPARTARRWSSPVLPRRMPSPG